MIPERRSRLGRGRVPLALEVSFAMGSKEYARLTSQDGGEEGEGDGKGEVHREDVCCCCVCVGVGVCVGWCEKANRYKEREKREA